MKHLEHEGTDLAVVVSHLPAQNAGVGVVPPRAAHPAPLSVLIHLHPANLKPDRPAQSVKLHCNQEVNPLIRKGNYLFTNKDFVLYVKPVRWNLPASLTVVILNSGLCSSTFFGWKGI